VATVTAPGGYPGWTTLEVLGCARAGDVHVLKRFPGYPSGSHAYALRIALAGAKAAVGASEEEVHYGGTRLTLDVYDLRSGHAAPGRDLLAECGGAGENFCAAQIGTVVANAAGASAAAFSYVEPCPTATRCRHEEIDARDAAALHAVDSADGPDAGPARLSDLTLRGDVLSWKDGGEPRYVTLP
jgi:hypothetical protein